MRQHAKPNQDFGCPRLFENMLTEVLGLTPAAGKSLACFGLFKVLAT